MEVSKVQDESGGIQPAEGGINQDSAILVEEKRKILSRTSDGSERVGSTDNKTADAPPPKPPKPPKMTISEDIAAEFYPPLPQVPIKIEDAAKISRGSTRLAQTLPVQVLNEEAFIDPETGRAFVTRQTVHKGRPASVTVEVASSGHISGIVSGTARLPGETDRQYFRAMSSFSRWQLSDSPGTKKISWEGDQKYAYFSMLVMLITGIILIVEIAYNGWAIEDFAVNPVFGPKREVLILLGAKRTDLILQGEGYRLIAAWWLHGGILHWVINMLALWNLGFSLEKEFGTPKIAIIFCTCGFMGVLCSAIFLPNSVGVGASGAIFGLFGAAWADLLQNWGLYKSRGNHRSVLCQLTFGTVLNLLLGLCPYLDQFAHLGGMFTGLAMGCALLLQKHYTRFGEEKGFKQKQRCLQICGAISVPLGMIIMLIILFVATDPHVPICSWCTAINCIPIPQLWNCDDSGCSDDPNVFNSGFIFPNSTLRVTCPSYVGSGFVYTTVDHTPTRADVIALCQAKCFKNI